MSKHGVLKVLTLLAVTLFSVQTALSFPMEVLDDPNFIPPNEREKADYSGLQKSTADISVNQYKSGDSVYFVCSELTFQSPTGAGSDCWGWADGNGTEYGIYASWNKIEFYNVTDGYFVDDVDAPASSWHDMKTYQNYCYAVSEGTGTNAGLMVIDMQYLPDSVHLVTVKAVNGSSSVTSHNLHIDTVAGYAYLEGTSSANSSVYIHSLANPANPTFVNSFGPAGGLHDMYCMNDTLYLAEGWNPSFSIWNMANKNAPALLTRVTVPNAGYVHNIWPSGDRRHVVTTEETANKTVKIWNIENLANVQLLGEYLAPSNLAHNAHMEGDTLYLSHYESGVAVVDISDPNNPTELVLYDTYPANESPNFNGCWGVYPHTPSGRFYASNMDGYFSVLREYDVQLADTIIAYDVVALPGSQIKVDIWAKWTMDIHHFDVPFNWGGLYNMDFDSVSTVGLVTEYFDHQDFSALDLFNDRASYNLTSSFDNSLPVLPAGEGVILSVYFTIPGGASGLSNPITFTPFNGKEPTFAHKCISYTPDTLSGEITLGDPPCCIGIRGNIDSSIEIPPLNNGIDISDLVYLVDYSFGGGPAPACEEEADIDASGGALPVDIADVVFLVNYMFASGPEPSACP